MRNAFCAKVELLFTDNPYDIERLSDAILYAYDCKEFQRTFFTTSAEFREKSRTYTRKVCFSPYRCSQYNANCSSKNKGRAQRLA